MKILFSEYQTDYSSYTFSYAVYCVKESQEELPEIYERGFLPYTGDSEWKEDVFYLARSLRVNLAEFKTLSENRRVDRKMEPLQAEMLVQPKEEVDTKDKEFTSFCTHYAEERFAGGSMDAQRLQYVLSRNLISHIFTFRNAERTLGYVFAIIAGNTLHYWYSFYDTEYMRSHSLGKWMMWKVIDWAKEQELDYVYIGTCYREKSLYKVRDHKGAEFYDGIRWNTDLELLKQLCRTDESSKARDLLKSDLKKVVGKNYFV
uniref:GNAT family N-acetyltransferase n=1 Tax=Roseihalotalea indica TaxID=2867963 RepID=A0AA49GII4_9BACT|nr:GNAT family N-acetyltransferase [Tunicatimonas sp. TK19036]